MHPWLGVGIGEFNFAWTPTSFPQRPVAFFDHTHNLVLNFLVELGIPLALLVLGLMSFALWRALQNAIADGRTPPQIAFVDTPQRKGALALVPRVPVQRPAFVIVVLVAVYSMLEYPLWYAYFLLPAAFAFGPCLERGEAAEPQGPLVPEDWVRRPFAWASIALMLGGTLAV